MRNKLLYIFLVVMLVINALLLYMILDKKSMKNKPKAQSFLTEELGFSEDQKERFFFLDREHRGQMLQLDEEQRTLRKKMFNSFGNNEFSPDSLINRMGEIEKDKQKELFAFFKEVRKLCNEDQIKKFDEIIQNVLLRRGPKPPGKGRKGPPRRHGPPEKDF
ncbi:hypothetical protein AAON49_08475 [Pseudotenacibaculum sp. MALMAid0570]|uniref:hypothetical protein n=1 Tax=Pseudotenacibaculum sp. MALMAid0570 TaxID=3143938 RepID=UPI0032DE97AC